MTSREDINSMKGRKFWTSRFVLGEPFAFHSHKDATRVCSQIEAFRHSLHVGNMVQNECGFHMEILVQHSDGPQWAPRDGLCIQIAKTSTLRE